MIKQSTSWSAYSIT